MGQRFDDVLDLDDRNNAFTAGLILGSIAGVIVASIAWSDVGAHARQKVTDAAGVIDLGAIQNRLPQSLRGGSAKAREAFDTARSLATDSLNQSPIPVTFGPAGEADPVESELESTQLDDETSQAPAEREESEARSTAGGE